MKKIFLIMFSYVLLNATEWEITLVISIIILLF